MIFPDPEGREQEKSEHGQSCLFHDASFQGPVLFFSLEDR